MKDNELIEKIFIKIKKHDIAMNKDDILKKIKTILEDRLRLKKSIDEVVEMFNSRFPSRFYEDWCYLLKKDSVSDKEIYSFLGTYSILDVVYSCFKQMVCKDIKDNNE